MIEACRTTWVSKCSDGGGFVKFDINLPDWETNVPAQKKIDVSYTKSTSGGVNGVTQYGMVTCSGCTITLSNSQAVPLPQTPKTDKDYARDDLFQDALPLAKVYCLPAGVFVSIFIAGSATAGLPGAGITLVVSGALGALITVPFCNAVIQRIHSDIQRIKDPPANDYNSLAVVTQPAPVSLPPCTTYAAPGQAFCAELRIALTNYVVAEEDLADTDVALVTSIDRRNTAQAANVSAAVTTQDQAITSFEQQMTAAVAQEHRMGASYVDILRSKGITATLSASVAAEGVTAFQHALQKAGVDPNSLTQIDAGAFASQPTDVLALTSGEAKSAGTPTAAVAHPKAGGGLGGAVIALIVILVVLIVGAGATVAFRSRRPRPASPGPER